jgi:biopolymer transport protein ExbB
MSKPNNAPAKSSGSSSKNNEMFAGLVILASLILSFIIFYTVMGSKGNFENGDPTKGHPLNTLGLVFKGGPIVPLLMTCAMCVIVFSVERFLTIRAATGNGSVADFVKKVQSNLNGNNVDAAIAECDKEMMGNHELDKDAKIASIQQEVEEATALEMPMLNKNMPILSTIASVGTLIALLGTVLGMIKSFSAMANAGAPDASALSTGISEALINTALGIGTSAVAIIMYNFFTTKIDALSYRIDEASFSMGQTFSTHHGK